MYVASMNIRCLIIDSKRFSTYERALKWVLDRHYEADYFISEDVVEDIKDSRVIGRRIYKPSEDGYKLIGEENENE